VSSWGDAFISLPPYLLYNKALVLKKRKVPLILFPSSIGPFTGGLKDYIAYRGLKKFDFITVRDVITYEYLKKYSLKSVKLIHDAAFVLKPEEDDVVDSLLSEIDLSGKKYIGINISILLYHEFAKNSNDYIQTMTDYILWLKEEFELPVLLIPHQIFPDSYEHSQKEYQSRGGDDRYAIELLLNNLEDKQGIHHLSKYYTPTELKGIIGKSEIFIGGRMHSVIGSISLCVPSLILEYSHKAQGMMKMLEMEDFVWTITSDEQSLRLKTAKLWKEKDDVRQKLSEIMPSIYDEIYSLANEIEKLISKR
jgi:polysaccharide pyruvyl transferase WcaK-like protein